MISFSLLTWGLLLTLAAFLTLAAWGDIQRFEIPNSLTGSVALLGLAFVVEQSLLGPLPVLPLIMSHLGAAIGVFIIGAGLFAAGIMGGGDVKLMAALALFTGLHNLTPVLFITSLAGGVVALTVFLIAKNQQKSLAEDDKTNARAIAKMDVPYGVAIAAGGLFFIGQLILNA
ncbi:MAG: prepilin peptidase [Pseudomonadota bacterium]